MVKIRFKNQTKMTPRILSTICNFVNKQGVKVYFYKNKEQTAWKMNSIINLLFSQIKKGDVITLFSTDSGPKAEAQLRMIQTEIDSLK